ncbi:NAD(P)/FAD-dependent oxidoreductase [Streptomyces iconiensis]|uniref:FAD-dependent monooxygenase n=1 Tax=Streptomyces iconiensis TaxID=1384038 RepID=A0ABT6ZQC9_9ACTN|nr:NAD(P)/FAD-dependent oxidoreductase [Streptomyces iconiensis]MDJ1131004.1 FAD-dependent monooxygenase [Streptomyces iconiensis]
MSSTDASTDGGTDGNTDAGTDGSAGADRDGRSSPSGTDRHFDVIVVGARCAGAPLATLLARRGLAVCLVEKATFPSDTPSTHIFEADALAFFDDLGVLDELRGTGAPLVGLADARIGDVRWPTAWPVRTEDPGGVMSVRRFRLDPVLARAAVNAGATLLTGTAVTGVVRAEDGRVTGVRVSTEEREDEGDGGDEGDEGEAEAGTAGGGGTGAGGSQEVLRARLVVGADGRNSTIARLCGAREYHVTPNQFALFWGYFKGAEIGEPTFAFHRWADRVVLGCPTDDGLYQVQVGVDPARVKEFRAGLPGSLLEYAKASEPVARVLENAQLVGKPGGMTHWEGYFREPTGPGWALVGDAGHFKDPTAGRGIGDALLQANSLAKAITAHLPAHDEEAGLGTGAGAAQRTRLEGELDHALREWGEWRDAEFTEAYWFAVDIGSLAPLPAVLPEVLREMRARGTANQLFEMVNHRANPSDILTGPRILRAVGRLLRHGKFGVLREVAALGARERTRRALTRRPAYRTSRHTQIRPPHSAPRETPLAEGRRG